MAPNETPVRLLDRHPVKDVRDLPPVPKEWVDGQNKRHVFPPIVEGAGEARQVYYDLPEEYARRLLATDRFGRFSLIRPAILMVPINKGLGREWREYRSTDAIVVNTPKSFADLPPTPQTAAPIPAKPKAKGIEPVKPKTMDAPTPETPTPETPTPEVPVTPPDVTTPEATPATPGEPDSNLL